MLLEYDIKKLQPGGLYDGPFKEWPMRFCRFGEGRLGLVAAPWIWESAVKDVTAALDVLPCCYQYPLPTHDVLIANLDKIVERAREIAPDAAALPLAGLKL